MFKYLWQQWTWASFKKWSFNNSGSKNHYGKSHIKKEKCFGKT